MAIYNFISFDYGKLQFFMVYASSIEDGVKQLQECYDGMMYSFVYVSEDESQALYEEYALME